jgi:hypothetical protein
MIAFVVVEGQRDVDLLQKILPPDLSRDVSFVAGGGINGVQSMARSLVTTRPWPVAIMIDADSADLEAVRARRDSVAEVVISVAGRVPVEVIVAIPELEVIFFEAQTTLSRTYPDVVTKPYLFEVAKENVRAAFRLLDPTATYGHITETLLNNVNDEDLPALWATKVISELIKFLESCRAHRVMMRVEIGPGVPFNIQPLKDTDGFKALLTLLVGHLTNTELHASFPSEATSGDVTVEFMSKRTQAGMVEPPGMLPSTFFVEVHGLARVRKDGDPSHANPSEPETKKQKEQE